MKVLAISHDRAGAGEADFKPHLRAEAAYVYGLYQNDIIREIYFEKDGPAAVIVLEAKDVDEARAALNGLPLVRNQLITFEFIPLIPYTGFARLFTRPDGSEGQKG